jgi:hypothetical protein
VFEFDKTISFGEEGVVSAYTNILARIDAGATLPDDDGSGADKLTIIAFDAQALGVAIATVPAGTATFLMSHCVCSL